jgi:putative tricarboxylic transport membrane protein
MMNTFDQLVFGFSAILVPSNLLICFLGVLLGTLVGVLPGFGAGAAMAILMTTTFKMSALSSIVMLAGILYGAMYGGSTTSILVNIPGEATSAVTCLDGYQMAKQGRAGPALGIAAFGSFIAGTFSIIMLMLIAPMLAEIALKFGYAEIFGLILLGLVMVSYLASESILKAFMMAALGMMLGMVGVDPMKGSERFSYGMITLMGGIGVVPVVMGIFGIPEVFENIEHSVQRELIQGKIKGFLPTRTDWRDSAGPIIRGSFMGFFLGTLPGIGVIIPTFISYAMEKKLSKSPEKFGTGMIAGVAGPEAANNAGVGGSMVPLMALGIPPTASMALFMGALMIHGVQAGPFFIKEHPDLFWGVIASMYVGNAMLLVLNLPLIGLWVRLLKVPYWVLAPLILLFCLVGSYSIDGYIYDGLLVILFGIMGYFMRKLGFEVAPFFLAFILGPMFERTFRQALIYSHGDLLIFFKRPISLILMCLAFLVIASNFLKVKKKLIKEEKGDSPFGQRAGALVLLAFAVPFFLQSLGYRAGSLRNPGPGFFPAILSAILGFLSISFFIKEGLFNKLSRRSENPWTGLKWYRTICVSVSLMVYVFVFEATGFLLSTLLLMQVLFFICMPGKWSLGILGAFSSSIVSYIIFKVLLNIPLPAGVLERLLHLS